MADARAVGLATALIAAAISTTTASVLDYQIIRLITYKTDCQVADFATLPPTGVTLHYHASCANMTFYPEGVDVVCSDKDDERSCSIATRAQSFDQLHLLDRK